MHVYAMFSVCRLCIEGLLADTGRWEFSIPCKATLQNPLCKLKTTMNIHVVEHLEFACEEFTNRSIEYYILLGLHL